MEENEQSEITFTNTEELYTVRLRKTDTNSNMLPGATLTLYRATLTEEEDASETESSLVAEIVTLDETVTSFTSTNSDKAVRLRRGTYLLRETEAPAGYRLADDVLFVIDDDGAATLRTVTLDSNGMIVGSGDAHTVRDNIIVEMVDEPYILTVKKVDTSNAAVPEAFLQLLTIQVTVDGNVTTEGSPENYLSFVTDANGEYDLTGLVTAYSGDVSHTEYILSELSAPVGYALSDEIRFRLREDDNGVIVEVKTEADTWTSQNDLTVTMVDQTEFAFRKEWVNATSEARLSWPQGQTIDISINRTAKYTDDGNNAEADGFELAYTLSLDNDGVPTWELTKGDETDYTKLQSVSEDGIYTFTLRDLPKYGTVNAREVEYTYYVCETQVDGWQSPRYYMGGNQIPGATRVQSGGTIVNAQVSVTLPSTGGPGTTFYTVAGLSIVLLAIALLLRKKEQY